MKRGLICAVLIICLVPSMSFAFPTRAFDGILEGLQQIFKSGTNLAKDAVKSLIHKYAPDLDAPDWMIFIVSSAVFAAVLSCFLSVPVGLVALILIVLGYAWY